MIRAASELGTTGFAGPAPVAIRAAVLLVEDDESMREMLREALEAEGYAVAVAASAEQGLDWLRRCRFNAVLTDYHLPNASGAWMLAQAAREGHLDNVPALIVTGDEGIARRDDFRVIGKPLDIDGLLETLDRAIQAAGERHRSGRADRPAARRDARGDGRGGNGAGQEPLELILYISSASVHSAAAIRNVQEALRHFNGPPVKLRIHDLAKDPHPKEAGAVVFTPALMSPGPGRRTWIVGNLQNPKLVLELLDDRRS